MKCMSGIRIVLLGNAARVGHAEERSISAETLRRTKMLMSC